METLLLLESFWSMLHTRIWSISSFFFLKKEEFPSLILSYMFLCSFLLLFPGLAQMTWSFKSRVKSFQCFFLFCFYKGLISSLGSEWGICTICRGPCVIEAWVQYDPWEATLWVRCEDVPGSYKYQPFKQWNNDQDKTRLRAQLLTGMSSQDNVNNLAGFKTGLFMGKSAQVRSQNHTGLAAHRYNQVK